MKEQSNYHKNEKVLTDHFEGMKDEEHYLMFEIRPLLAYSFEQRETCMNNITKDFLHGTWKEEYTKDKKLFVERLRKGLLMSYINLVLTRGKDDDIVRQMFCTFAPNYMYDRGDFIHWKYQNELSKKLRMMEEKVKERAVRFY